MNLFIVAILMGYILREGHVTLDKLMAAVAVYLFLGALWARLYQALHIAEPESFNLEPWLVAPGADWQSPYIYFSFVTLTTLGYGDVLPLTPVARNLAILESTVGVLYLAILISRLASLYGGRILERDEDR